MIQYRIVSKYIYLLITLLIIPTVLLSASEVEIKDGISSYSDFQVDYYLEKPGPTSGIGKISKLPFKDSMSNSFSLGYKKDNLWLRFKIRNDTNSVKEMVLELTEIIHKTADIYILSDLIIHKKNGLDVPVNMREIQESDPSFPLYFSPGETKEIYVHISTIYGLFGSLQLKTQKQYYKDLQTKKYIYTFYFSVIIIIALYNLVIFFYLKEKIYLYYIGYVFTFIVWAANYKGILLPYTDIKIYDFLQLTIPLFFTLLILFTRSLLMTKIYFPFLHKIFNGFIIVLMISFFWMMIDMHTGFYFMNLAASPLLPFLLFVAFWALYKGQKIAKLYLVALSIYIVSMIIISQLALGLIPYTITISHSAIIGSFFEIILFSLLLAYRINLLRQEQINIQEKLLIQEQNEASRLTQMVESQTASLRKIKDELELELEERKKLEKHLQIQADTDPLTNILNRRSFFEGCTKEIESAITNESQLILLLIDIDHFKYINDTYGHQVGDQAIIAVTNEIKNSIRTTDIFGRIGGEEFALLMPATPLETALLLAERIRANIAQKQIQIGHHIIEVTISIGLATFTKSDTGIRDLLHRSDQALYQAKENGRNQVCYDEC